MTKTFKEEAEKILYDLANFYTKRGKEGYTLDGSDYEGFDDALAQLQQLHDAEVAEALTTLINEAGDYGSLLGHDTKQIAGWLAHTPLIRTTKKIGISFIDIYDNLPDKFKYEKNYGEDIASLQPARKDTDE